MTMLTGLVARKISAPILLAIAGAILALSTVFMLHITILIDGLLASVLFGMALGMILTLLPERHQEVFINFIVYTVLAVGIFDVTKSTFPMLSLAFWVLLFFQNAGWEARKVLI